MEHFKSLENIQRSWPANGRSYALGFIGSLALTLLAFYLTAEKIASPLITIYVISALALVQALVQLKYFFHVGEEPKPKWETVVFLFMLVILLVIVIGSLWVMFDLNARMMPEMPK